MYIFRDAIGLFIAFFVISLVITIGLRGRSDNRKEKLVKIGSWIVLIISIIGLIAIFVISRNEPKAQNDGIITLTDDYIQKEIGGKDNWTIVAIVGVSILLIPIMIGFVVEWIKAIKERDKILIKDYPIGILICLVLYGLLVGVPISRNSANFKEKEWFITIDTVVDKRRTGPEYHLPGSKGETIYYLTIEGEKDEIEVTKDEYQCISKGDEVYTVRNEDGSIRGTYSLIRYKYTGNKLR